MAVGPRAGFPGGPAVFSVFFVFSYSSHSPHLKEGPSHVAVGKWWHWQLNSNRIPFGPLCLPRALQWTETLWKVGETLRRGPWGSPADPLHSACVLNNCQTSCEQCCQTPPAEVSFLTMKIMTCSNSKMQNGYLFPSTGMFLPTKSLTFLLFQFKSVKQQCCML